MKKFLPYTLIFIMLVGTSGQIVFAAVDVAAKGDCYNPRTHETIPLTTKIYCENATNATPSGLGGIWTQTVGPSCNPPKVLVEGPGFLHEPDCQTPIPTPGTTETVVGAGNCWLNGTILARTPFIIPSGCSGQGGTWQEDGAAVPTPPNGPAAGQAPEPSKWGICWSGGVVIGTGPFMIKSGCTGAWQEPGAALPKPPEGPPEGTVLPPGTPPISPSTFLAPLPSSPLIKNCASVDKNNNCLSTKAYVLLSPLPCDSSKDGVECVNGKLASFDPTGDNKIGTYLNILIRIFIGLCAVLAVIMIVVGGIEYMTSELISNKEEGKKRILGAVFGLVLALGAYTLLYTINPDILNTDLKSLKDVTVEVTVNAPEGGALNEGVNAPAVCGAGSTIPSGANATGYCMAGTPTSPKPSAGVSQMADFINKNSGSKITQIDIGANKQVNFIVTDSSGKTQTFSTSALGLGANGIAEAGTAVPNDMKTPVGNWAIANIITKPDQATRIVNETGKSMGGVALMLNVGNRGIAIHGNSNNAPGTSAGCVIMSNDDLFTIAKYVSVGTKVNIWGSGGH